ncbi:RYamide receptor [Pseudolycoriella hygida]|uniref:RYamide receptor n=1 Tax=Pseudolycoriella hygida TaxID=35572 RepID=A0A9Q0S324_9DIPT|nr:RYamide receptor [Pseudolycoriella hygida]
MWNSSGKIIWNSRGKTVSNSSENDFILDTDSIDLATLREEVIIFCQIIAVIGLLGNALVLFILAKTPKMQTIITKFIANLAVTDLLFFIIVISRRLYYRLNGATTNIVLCKFATYLATVLTETSNFTLVVISIERCIIIKYPFVKIAPKYYNLSICFIWLLAAIKRSPILIVSKLITLSNNKTRCVQDWQTKEYMDAMSWSIIIFDVIIPLAIILTCYISIWRNAQQNSIDEVKRRHIKMARMIFVIIVAYIVTLTPYYNFYGLAMLSKEFRTRIQDKTSFHSVVICLLVIHSSMNPFIYCFKNKRFRKRFKELILRRISRMKDEREIKARKKKILKPDAGAGTGHINRIV